MALQIACHIGALRATSASQWRPRQERVSANASVTKTSATAYSVASKQGPLSLGLDFGTSGARAVCINSDKEVVYDNKVVYQPPRAYAPLYWIAAWKRALQAVIFGIPKHSRADIIAISVAGTTTTSILVDRGNGKVLAEPILYNQPQSTDITKAAAEFVPKDHSAGASVSSLCKLLYWHEKQVWQQAVTQQRADPVLLHHADWIASLFTEQHDHTDWHNAARLGFDAAAETYPDWLLAQEFASVLPKYPHEPGTGFAQVAPDIIEQLGFAENCMMCAGTTDSVAAFLAAGVAEPGEAVSSLGSTLAVDLLSTAPVDSAKYGICSYRWRDNWIVDGGSNTGGAVLQQFFSERQLAALMPLIDPSTNTGLKYYPLLGQGQRFPVNDPQMQPVMSPRPGDDAKFLQGLLEGIANIEAEAYALLNALGATPVSKVYTAGGGAANDAWRRMRQQLLQVPVETSPQAEAAYGAALLALQGCNADR